VDPSERSPFRRCDFKKTNRQKEKKRGNPDQNGDNSPTSDFRLLTSDLWRWPILPAEPKKVEGKERHKPPVVVLLIDQPFAAELPAQDEPESTEKEKRQRKSR
jgi:hypothetical protein